MRQQVPVKASARANHHQEGKLAIVAPDLAYARLAIVNVVLYGQPGAGDRRWLLIDVEHQKTATHEQVAMFYARPLLV